MTYEKPLDLPLRERVELDPDTYGRTVLATRIGGLIVYEVDGLGAHFETAQPATKPFAAVYELIDAHAPA